MSFEEDEVPSPQKRPTRWKLRSSVISAKNYNEESSASDDDDEDVEEVESSSSEESDDTVTKKKLEPKASASKNNNKGDSDMSDFEDEVKITKTVVKKPPLSSASKSASKLNNGTANSANKRKLSKRKAASLSGTRSIASYFGKRSSPSPSTSPSPKKNEPKKRKMDPATRAFLDSGVPDVVIKTQKLVEKKKEEDDYLSTVGFFPKIHHTGHLEEPEVNTEKTEEYLKLDAEAKLKFKRLDTFSSLQASEDAEDLKINSCDAFSSFINSKVNLNKEELQISQSRRQVCCNFLENSKEKETKGCSKKVDMIPWIDKYKVNKLKNLVCDKKALGKLTMWLKQWKSDIKDDGGASRRQEKKRRKRDSDSDFVTSDDEDDDVKKKSVLLGGPAGCGKTAAVYVTAQHYGFHVVEVNFSSRRSGKEVLQRVEEAVLSQRLESSENCLLLFEDIDLIDPKEDEGFHAAVAQLITTALRPIVMTTSQPLYSQLDPKIEKRDPFLIQFEYPKTSQIIRKILLPIIKDNRSAASPKKSDGESEDEKDVEVDARMMKLLDSISRHGRGDIRQVINQSQFLFAGESYLSGCGVSGSSIHQHSMRSFDEVDIDFVRGPRDQDDEEEDMDTDDSVCLSVEARKRKSFEEMDNMAEMMGSLADLDFVNGLQPLKRHNQFYEDEEDLFARERKLLKSSYFDPLLCSKLSKSFIEGGEKSRVVTRKLILESDEEVEMSKEIYKLSEEVKEYCDNYEMDGSWDTAATVRGIVKKSKMDSVGRLAKRNGRLTCYFNRLDRDFVDRVCATFGYDKELHMAKELMRISDKF